MPNIQNLKSMILKNSILAAFAFLSFAVNAQAEKATEIIVTEFKVETDNLGELKNFDWNIVTKMFEANTPETEIKIVIAYAKKVQFNTVDVDDFKLKVAGKTSELVSLINRSKGIISKLSAVN